MTDSLLFKGLFTILKGSQVSSLGQAQVFLPWRVHKTSRTKNDSKSRRWLNTMRSLLISLVLLVLSVQAVSYNSLRAWHKSYFFFIRMISKARKWHLERGNVLATSGWIWKRLAKEQQSVTRSALELEKLRLEDAALFSKSRKALERSPNVHVMQHSQPSAQ